VLNGFRFLICFKFFEFIYSIQVHKSSLRLPRSRLPTLTTVHANVQESLPRRAAASASLIPPFQQTLLSKGDVSMHREIIFDNTPIASAVNSGSNSPLPRNRNDTTASAASALSCTTTVVVPIVNSSALLDRDHRKASRADSTDSTTSTLPGELLLYEPISVRSAGEI
jgi:hypothetical protein